MHADTCRDVCSTVDTHAVLGNPFLSIQKVTKRLFTVQLRYIFKNRRAFLFYFIVAHIERIIKTASAERVTRLRNNNNNISASMTKMKRKNIHLYYRFTFQKRVPYSRQDSCADSVAADAVKIDACVHYFTLTKMITPSHFSSWHFYRLSYWFSFVWLNWTPPGIVM